MKRPPLRALCLAARFPFWPRCWSSEATCRSPTLAICRGAALTTMPVSSPSSVLVVQPRMRPEWLLKSRLAEALRLVEALCARSSENLTRPKQMAPGPLPTPVGKDKEWWPSGVPDSICPWVVVGPGDSVLGSQGPPGGPLSSASFFRKGAIETVAAHVRAADRREEGRVEAVFVNATLSGGQQRELEQAWGKRVVDRVGLIIDIFGAHAASREAKLQVELAALQYQRSRLVRQRSPESGARKGFGAQGNTEVVSARGRGGAGGRGFLAGAGESELRVQRTRIAQRQHRLRRMLDDVRRTRALHRAGRKRRGSEWGTGGSCLPVVAVVGYTSAGKSSLVSALSRTPQFCDDQLFATLDPRLRAVHLPSGRRALLSDTVGFISDLPVELVEAFHASLEEVVKADLVLHVIDGSAPDRDSQRSAVLDVLSSLGLSHSDSCEGSARETSAQGGPATKRNGQGRLQSWAVGQSSQAPIIEVWNKADLWPGGLEWVHEASRDAEKQPDWVWTSPPPWSDVVRNYSMQMRRELRLKGSLAEMAPPGRPLQVKTSAISGYGLDMLLRAIDDTLSRRKQ